MVPLSTRNTKQRDGLAMLTSAGMNMIPGLLVTIIRRPSIRLSSLRRRQRLRRRLQRTGSNKAKVLRLTHL